MFDFVTPHSSPLVLNSLSASSCMALSTRRTNSDPEVFQIDTGASLACDVTGLRGIYNSNIAIVILKFKRNKEICTGEDQES